MSNGSSERWTPKGRLRATNNSTSCRRHSLAGAMAFRKGILQDAAGSRGYGNRGRLCRSKPILEPRREGEGSCSAKRIGAGIYATKRTPPYLFLNRRARFFLRELRSDGLNKSDHRRAHSFRRSECPRAYRRTARVRLG